jgi:hypothetical protein
MTDPFLDALERRAAVCCVAFAVVAWLVTRGWRAPAGVLGGGVLIGVSFYAIRSSIEQIAPRRGEIRRGAPAGAVVKMAGRYALLAILAYVMIARLRLHPVALLLGASSVAAATALEAGRLLRKK